MPSNATNTTHLEVKCARKEATLYSSAIALLASPVYILMLKILIYRFRLRLPRDKILLSLTVSDSIQIVIVAVLQLSVFDDTVDSIGCQIIRKVGEFTVVLTVVSSSGSILLLSWERYMACVHCLRFYKIVTHEKVNRMLCGVWALAFVCGFLEKGRYEANISSSVMPFPETDTIIYVITVLSTSTVLVVVQVRLYLLSYRKTKDNPSGITFGKKAEENDYRKTQFKIAIVASAIVLLYMICMCPLAIYLISAGFKSRDDNSATKIASIMLILINALMNPFVYGLGMADARKAIKKELKEIKSFFVNLLPTS